MGCFFFQMYSENLPFTTCYSFIRCDSHLGLQVLHGLLKCLGWSPLVVTQDGHGPVGPVVGQDLGRNVVVRWRRTSRKSVNE